ncbi:MAG: transcriptional regulator [Planctomycetota bacterium]|nr:transcriptional regulator [Planctomycetota bacterium]
MLDPLIHAPARLAIMTRLFVIESADATWLLAETGLTWGNLSSHMTKLEQVGYVEVIKGFVDNKPKTLLRLTDRGRQAFLDYRQQIQDMLHMPLEEEA